MCGFTIILNKKNKKIKKNIKDKILQSQSHRGPDYSKYIEKDRIIFFHNRLSVIDLSTSANQPMKCKLTGNIIVFNGEIYNFNELKRRYLSHNKFYSNSDTEVLLLLYKKYGTKFIKLLNGMFSIVIYDLEKKYLFIARDRFGIKPLLYYENSDFFICSTEVVSINTFVKDIKINYTKINEYLDLGFTCHDNLTFFEGIKKIPASYSFVYDTYKFRIKSKEKYWDLKKDKSLIEKKYEDFEENYSLHFKNSLKETLVSDVPVALLLSSGSDSTYIFNQLKEMKKKQLKSFSFGWHDRKYDEALLVKKSLRLSYKDHKILNINFGNFYSDLDKAIAFNEGPIGGFGTLALFRLMKFIKINKFKVTISGEGSDEINLGYFNQHISYLNENPKNRISELKNFNKIYKNNHSLRYLKKNYLHHLLSAPDGTSLGNNIKKNKFYRTDEIIKNYVFKYKLPKLLHWQDRCGAAFGIESRYPFLDHNLVTYCFSNPDKYKIKNGISKFHLKNINRELSKKKYVVTPQREFIKKNFNNINEIISNGLLVRNNLIDLQKFSKDYKYYSEVKNLGNSFFVWKILNLEIFMRSFEKNKLNSNL